MEHANDYYNIIHCDEQIHGKAGGKKCIVNLVVLWSLVY